MKAKKGSRPTHRKRRTLVTDLVDKDAILPNWKRLRSAKESPFYCSVFEEVYFPRLQYYASKKGNQKLKKAVKSYVSPGALVVQEGEGLTFPVNVRRQIYGASDESIPYHWFLAFNDLHSTTLYCLFPVKESKRLDQGTPWVEVLTDSFEFMDNWYSLFAQKLYVWPEIIKCESHRQVKGAYNFKIPPLFLKVLAGNLPTFEDLQPEPTRLFFDLFYSRHPLLLYFRVDFEDHVFVPIEKVLEFPREIHFPKGCRWSLLSRGMKSSNLAERNRYKQLANWISPVAK